MAEPEREHRMLDWDDIKRRLLASAGFEESAEDLERIFDERAEALARVAVSVASASALPHLCFRIGEARFALPSTSVRTILNPKTIARIPSAPAHLAHVIHAQGRLVPLIDLTALMPTLHGVVLGKPRDEGFHAILLDGTTSPLGLLVERVDGLRALELGDASSSVRSGPGAEFLRGITSDMTLVIDPALLVTALGNKEKKQ